jgi:hypothetical protein
MVKLSVRGTCFLTLSDCGDTPQSYSILERQLRDLPALVEDRLHEVLIIPFIINMILLSLIFGADGLCIAHTFILL